MPVNSASLAVTDHYRDALDRIALTAERSARDAWSKLDWANLDKSYVPISAQASLSIQAGQREAVRLSAGYLTAYLSSELGTKVATPAVPVADYVGKTYRGKALADSLDAPLVKVKVANGKGQPDPMGTGLKAMLAMTDLNVKHAGRKALQDLLVKDDRITGYRRATSGTCPACLALASSIDAPPGTPLRIHPHCKCVAEPVVGGLTEKVARPSGEQQFEAMTKEVQDATFGSLIADALRQGLLALVDLVLEVGGFVKPKPMDQLPLPAAKTALPSHAGPYLALPRRTLPGLAMPDASIGESATGGTKDYNPNEPRDPATGQWISSPGGGDVAQAQDALQALLPEGAKIEQTDVGTEDAIGASGRHIGPSLDPLHGIKVSIPGVPNAPNAIAHGLPKYRPGTGESVALLRWHRDTGEISSISVDARYRRKGIASAMLDLARARAKAEGTARPEHSANLSHSGAQFAQGTGETHLFATPARSERQDAESYYSTPRWAQFQSDVKRQADDLGVTINDQHLTQGIWSDAPEPSAAFYLHGEHTNELAARVGRYWNQDAVLNFRPVSAQQLVQLGDPPDAPDAEWHFFGAGKGHTAEEVLAAAKKHGLYGATRDGDDIVVVAGPGVGAPEDKDALTAFGEELGATQAKRFQGIATMIWNPELPIGERPEGAPTYDTYDPQGDRRKAGGVSGWSRYNGDAPDQESAEAAAEAFAAKAADLLLERLGLKDYDPNEPRDPHTGQWIKGAGAEIAAEDVAAGDRITSGSGATGTITSREPHKVPGTADRLHIQWDGDPPSYTSPLVTELRKFTRQRKDPWKVHRPQTGGEHTFPHEEAFTGKPTDVHGDVGKAAQLLSEGKPVKLDHKREVATLLDKIGEIVKDAKAKGDKAPTYDLCKVVVPGTNLFCSKTKGIPRIDMPQLTGIPVPGSAASKLPKDDRGNVDLTPAFIDHLKAQGFKVHSETERADHLRPTQMQLNGGKVAGIVKFLNSGGTIEGGPLVVSKDNYIVDGHHRWASEVAQSLESGHEQRQKVLRVDIGIIDLLREALKFTEANGLKPQSVSDTSGKLIEALLKAFDPNQPRDPATGRWIDILGNQQGGGLNELASTISDRHVPGVGSGGTLQVTAGGSEEHGYSVNVTGATDTAEQADRIVAEFPKSYNVKRSGVSGAAHPLTGKPVHPGTVNISAQLRSSGVTGAKNEAGAERLRKFADKARKLGLRFSYRHQGGDSVPTDSPILKPFGPLHVDPKQEQRDAAAALNRSRWLGWSEHSDPSSLLTQRVREGYWKRRREYEAKYGEPPPGPVPPDESGKAFDPNQPRDSATGRWIHMGGGLISRDEAKRWLADAPKGAFAHIQYHGTDAAGAESLRAAGPDFQHARITTTPTFFTTNSEEDAKLWGSGEVLPVAVRFDNPLVVTGPLQITNPEVYQRAQEAGHDGIVWRPGRGETYTISFSPGSARIIDSPGGKALFKVFNPDQPRDPKTGEWIKSRSTYTPDLKAPAEGEFVMVPDPSGTYPGGVADRWRQQHRRLVEDAIYSWSGDPVTMSSRMADERAGLPQPDSGSGKQMRAQAAALLWELEHKSKPNPVPLYRGDSGEGASLKRGWESWSEDPKMASGFAASSDSGQRVVRLLPGQAVGIRPADYLPFDSLTSIEQEWIAKPYGVTGKAFDPAEPRDAHGRWVHVPSQELLPGASGGVPSYSGAGPLSDFDQEDEYLDEATDRYVGGWSGLVNRRLRGQAIPKGKDVPDSNEIQAETTAIDEAINVRGTVLKGHYYRGLDLGSVAPSVRKAIDGPPGGTFTDPGFLSTTGSVGVANNFAEERLHPVDPVILDISYPQGAKGMLLVNVLNEDETVLPRGGSFKVVSSYEASFFPGGPQRRVVSVEWRPPSA